MKSLLIVEDDITFSIMMKTLLTKKGFNVSTVSNIYDAKKVIVENQYDLILSDMRLPDEEGEDLLKWLLSQNRRLPFIIMTSYADIQAAVRVIKLGAFDYITKPFHPEDLLTKINEALKTKEQSTTQKIEPNTPHNPTNTKQHIKGNSAAAVQLYNHVNLVAPTNMSVLIQGASGTGKEHIAHLIHTKSTRANKPFIAIDCGAIPKDLAASEFFGHIKGAFTGAIDNKIGALVAAQGGTIFLDEIGNLSYDTQIKLLRAIQERVVCPIGSNKEISIDIRIISATNEDLIQGIEAGTFREDLYHRINEFSIRIPDLKERVEDLPDFIDYFLKESNKELNKNIEGFTTEAFQALLQYAWPGNIRQLQNTIRKANLLTQEALIPLANLDLDNYSSISTIETEFKNTIASSATIELYDEDTEKEKILAALKFTKNNKTKAAQMLKIDRKTLYNKIKLYEIEA